MSINILSLFDGISGTQQALKNLGIKCNVYMASEIDKYAIQVTMKNFPNTIQLGSVTDVRGWLLPYDVDLMTWGSPCQDLSIAKKDRKGLDGERSGLFWEAVRIWREVQPKYWLMENVASMSREARDTISDELGVEPIMINSSLVSAQQRKRFYWTNIPGILQPQDQNVFLKDIIETGDVDKLKSYCIDANYYKGTNLETYLEKAKRQIVFDRPNRIGQLRNGGQADRVYSLEGKSVSLSANGGGMGAKTGLYACRQVGRKINEQGKRDDYNPDLATEQRIEINENPGKTNCLTRVQKDNYVMQDTVIRKLTPIECERLQTFPDNYTEGISNTQRYKCLGNSFTVKVIEHILGGILNDESNRKRGV